MFYFFIDIFLVLIMILTIYFILNKKEIGILEILILLFSLNISVFGIYNNFSFMNIFLANILVLIIYYFYKYLEDKKIVKNLDKECKVFINRGVINFRELIANNYTYNDLLYSLKKKGISNPNMVDYCIKQGNDIVVFGKNSLKNYPISLIIDGNIIKDNLLSINHTNEWLNKKLEENNLKLPDINYAYYKGKRVYFVTN